MRSMVGMLVVLSACALVGCLGPDPAIKAALDQRVAQITPNTTAYRAAHTPAIVPIKTGQWIQTKTVTSKGEIALTTVKIVGQEGNAFWQEIVTDTYSGRAILKKLIDFGDQKNHDTMKILRILIKGAEGDVLEFPPGLVPSNSPHAGMSLGMIQSTRLSQEDLQVLAGQFAQSYTGLFTVPHPLGSISGTGWWHSAVPINGVLKLIIREGNSLAQEGIWELVAFGLQGATSEF